MEETINRKFLYVTRKLVYTIVNSNNLHAYVYYTYNIILHGNYSWDGGGAVLITSLTLRRA